MSANASNSRRILAVAAAAFVAVATMAPVDADARAGRGGSFGSRGGKTFSAPPPTATAPGAAPIQRSITQPGPSTGAPGIGAQAPRTGGFFNRFGTGIAAGLLGAGLFGLLSGSGFFGGLGSLSAFFGLLIQIVLIVLAVRLVMGWLRRRNEDQTATAGGPSSYGFDRSSAPDDAGGSRLGGGLGGGRGYGYGGGAPAGAFAPAKEDFDVFERMLSDVQAAWSAQDLPKLRSLATPEMVEVFAEDLSDLTSRGLVNKVSDVSLLQGDLAEAWSEGAREFATVAMRYRLIDVTTEQANGRVVEGDPDAPIEATEIWTFIRASGGRWLLSAIQQAE